MLIMHVKMQTINFKIDLDFVILEIDLGKDAVFIFNLSLSLIFNTCS